MTRETPAYVPHGYEVDFETPTEWVVRCPDCKDKETHDRRPNGGTVKCGPCDRMKGVTPVSRKRKHRSDGGYVSPDDAEKNPEWLDHAEQRNRERTITNDRLMTDGGTDEPPKMGNAVNGFSGLYPRHVGGTRYRVLSIRNDQPTAYKVDTGDLSCTCPDHRYHKDDPQVCDHLATALHAAPHRISVEENIVSDLSHLVRELGEAADDARDAANEFEGALVSQRSAEADTAAETDTERPEGEVESTTGGESVGNPADPLEKAEDLQEAFDRVTDDMKVEVSGDLVWIQTGFDTPDTLDVMGSPETWPTLIKNPDLVEYDPDHSESPGEYWKNFIRPGHVDRYISEVLE